MTTLLFTSPLLTAIPAGVLWTALLLTLAALLIWSAIGRSRCLEQEKRNHRLSPERAKDLVEE